jgi:sugar phosphate isomerase/epimerase
MMSRVPALTTPTKLQCRECSRGPDAVAAALEQRNTKSVRLRPLSISTAFDYEIPIDVQIPLIAEAGFTHISLGEKEAHSGYLSQARRDDLKGLLDQQSIRIDTIHGPRADQPGSIELFSAVAEAAEDLSASIVVVHGGPFGFPEAELPARLDALLRTCEALQPVAQITGVIFALENVLPGPATDLVRQALPSLHPKHFGFCYDSSHDQIGGPKPFDLLAELKDRVVAVHLSDRIREFVDHVLPGEGFIDWRTLCKLLRVTRLAGPLLLEVMVTHSVEKQPDRFLKLAYERGCGLYDLMGDE